MSELGDIENAVVTRLAAATISGSPVFDTVRGVSGGYRAVIRDAMRRERMPAAYVAFIEEPTAPEVKPSVRGAKFVVLIAERALRLESDPRHGDADTLGAFTLLDETREELDDYQLTANLQLINLHQKFVEADDRVAVYELLYRVWPIPDAEDAPAAPSLLTAALGATSTQVRLSWTPPAESASDGIQAFYRVYRKTPSDSAFVLYDTATGDATEKTLDSQPKAVTLQYYVTAVNTGGEGPASNVAVILL